jgi:hypothetical protein
MVEVLDGALVYGITHPTQDYTIDLELLDDLVTTQQLQAVVFMRLIPQLKPLVSFDCR